MFDFTTYQVGDIPLFMYAMVGMTTMLITYATVHQSNNNPVADIAPVEPAAPAEQVYTAEPSTVGGKRRSKRRKGRGKRRTKRV